MNRSRATRTALCTLAAAGVLLTGCGDDGEPSASPTTEAASATADPTTTAHDGHEIEVTAVDFAFEDLPRTIKAGTRLTLANDAETELHELVAFRLPDDEQRSVEELLSLPESELGPILNAAPPATVLLTPPGGDQVPAVGDGTLSEPGRYLIMCSIPTGVDPAAYLAAAAEAKGEKPDVAGGPPHFVHGMAAELVVEA